MRSAKAPTDRFKLFAGMLNRNALGSIRDRGTLSVGRWMPQHLERWLRLRNLAGSTRPLAPYIHDNTPVCTRQFCSYRDRPQELAALGATVVGISGQDVASHEGFVAKNSLTVPLLADVDGAVAKLYSAHGRLGTKRAVIVIDEQGVVRHRHDHMLGLDYQSVDELKAVLDALPAPAAS